MGRSSNNRQIPTLYDPMVPCKAQRHLARRDPILRRLIAKIGPCTMTCCSDRFEALTRCIISQQISTKAARTIQSRLVQTLSPEPLTPQGFLALSDEARRQAGLSAAKARSLCDLATKVQSGLLSLDALNHQSDDEVIASLVPVVGIGPWTAQMFLIFSLGRADILPVADLGLRVGVQQHYGLAERPDPDRLVELAAPWRPYRSIATWYFWRSFGFVPQSQLEVEE
jgi:DNA-3-methyladenine glycosylase II